jgi:ubiquinone/menaquinone biosynthesis C-methylase UbiE
MSIYSNCVLPHLVHLAMRNQRLLPYRERTISAAEGRVLEIGIGSGLNLPLYSSRVNEVIGLEPAPRLLSMAREQLRRVPVKLIEGSADAIPIESGSVDTVVTTWTLCTIPAVAQALAEMHRVLRSSGQLLFVEHGLAPDASVRKWQDWLTPAWKRIGGGCHLNRPIQSLIERNGFRLTQLEMGYMAGPKPMAFMYQGSARPN